MQEGSKQFNTPLFGTLWSITDHIVVAGGGGKAKTGVLNKIQVCANDDGYFTEETQTIDMKDACLLRVAKAPNNKYMLGADSYGNLRRFELTTDVDGNLIVQENASQVHPELAGKGCIYSIAISPRGRYLAIGTSQGTVEFWENSIRAQICEVGSDVCPGQEVKDVDVRAWGEDVVGVSVWDRGTCMFWNVTGEGPHQLIELPPGIKGSISRAQFVRSNTLQLLVLIASKNKGSVLALYTHYGPEGSQPHLELCKFKSIASYPGRAFCVHSNGYIAAHGDVEGNIRVIDTNKLSIIGKPVKRHETFITDVSFSPIEHAVVSVSGDSTASMTWYNPPTAKEPTNFLGNLILFGLILALLVVIYEREDVQADIDWLITNIKSLF